MYSRTIVALVVCVTAVAGCSQSPETMTSPTAVSIESTAVNPDGSNLKVGAPTNLSPTNAVNIDTVRPTLSFTNASGQFVPVGLAYEVEITNANNTVVYQRLIGESANASSHVLDTELTYSDNFWWRVRARLADGVGPWSGWAEFRTPPPPAPPAPPAPTPGSLPFPVPAECGPFGPGDRTACINAMTQVSPWWPDCRAGSGVGCHRFTRSVAAALAASEPGWGLLSKNPGEQQCSWNACGGGVRGGYGEDVVAHFDGTLRGWDIVTGAGAPGAGAGWSRLSSFRGGNNWVPVPLPLGTQ